MESLKISWPVTSTVGGIFIRLCSPAKSRNRISPVTRRRIPVTRFTDLKIISPCDNTKKTHRKDHFREKEKKKKLFSRKISLWNLSILFRVLLVNHRHLLSLPKLVIGSKEACFLNNTLVGCCSSLAYLCVFFEFDEVSGT